ncbi:glycosyltransferase [Roseomonas nepalensis]|uniref:Glycosyltransferase n=1 Tax=Muricoccus nepalensis TaxID=1854500 RepID=A0A502FAM6_9PROT|nr:glycosyltransferase [Roseomonas nepalensis]TPG46412.1 glycosyltransferase [Roseomonas nepalensis]
MLIDVFSPLPPLQTEIANHTAGVLRALGRKVRVRAWTSQEGPVELAAPEVEVRRFRPDDLPVATLNQAEATFYNLGNNARFHLDIHQAARRMPGIVVLHDIKLQHFFANYGERPGADREYYLAQLEASHGPVLREKGEAFLAGRLDFEELVSQAPMTLAALAGATGGVLHNAAELAALKGQTHVPLYSLPLSSDFGPLPARRKLADGDELSRLVMFGYIGNNRRLLPVLETLAAMPDRDRYRLDIYGIVEQADEADALISRAGLSERVTRHGFVPDAELDAALATADLALNLRWPTMGEASAAQLRLWAAGCPSLVTDVGWYAQLPPETVFHIDPSDERGGIEAHLRALRRDPAVYARAGLAGRRVLERLHAPDAYADGLLRIAAQHVAQHARHQGHALARRAAAALLQVAPPELARPLGAEVARRIAELTRD